jgi:anaerobic selenocysteine-containing dehydrogenase
MAVQINEVVVRAIITGTENSNRNEAETPGSVENIAGVSKDELLELIEEVINDKKER